MSKNRYRCIVKLTDVENDDERYALASVMHSKITLTAAGTHVQQLRRRDHPTDIEVVNCNTLLMIERNPRQYRQMHFHCVSRTVDPLIHDEIASLMDQLIVEHRSCCLIQFNVLRELQLPFICNLLVTEVEKRLQNWQCSLNQIVLEYYDVRKFDMVNMLGRHTISATTKMRAPMRPTKSFTNLQDLMKWLRMKFTHLWTIGQGHTCIDLQIIFSDAQHHLRKVKLSLTQLYLNKMDSETRTGLRYYLANVGGGEKKMKDSMVTNCLNEYFKGTENWRTWLYFDVPVINCRRLVTEELLQLASAAYASLNILTEDAKSLVVEQDYESSNMKVNSTQNIIELQTAPVHVFDDPLSSLSKTITLQESLASKITEQKAKINQDLVAHAYWKLDVKFPIVLTAMEAYYNCKYQGNITKMCEDIKQMSNAINLEGKAASNLKLNTKMKPYNKKRSKDLQELYKQYKEQLSALHVLINDIEKSQHGEFLTAYLNTKKNELMQYELRFKVAQLENCNLQLSNVIRQEVDKINGIKQRQNKETVAEDSN